MKVGGLGLVNKRDAAPVPRAQYFFYWIYYFTDEGIIRVQLMSWAGVFGAALGIGLVSVGFFYVLLTLMVQGIISPHLSILLFVVGLGGVVGGPYIFLSLKERQVLGLTTEQLAGRKSTVHIPWTGVKEVRLKGWFLRIRTQDRNYKALVSRSDLQVTKDYIQSKIGERLVVQS